MDGMVFVKGPSGEGVDGLVGRVGGGVFDEGESEGVACFGVGGELQAGEGGGFGEGTDPRYEAFDDFGQLLEFCCWCLMVQ